MTINNQNKTSVAKNTLFLYIRTILIMFVSLYTVRVVIQALGVSDYGVYNIVGGVVATLGVINASLSGAASRFISFSIGKNDERELRSTFASIKLMHWILAGLVIVIGETLGLWFVLEKLILPTDRVLAALICYQFSLATSVVSIVSVPYNSLIIGHEKMSVYAYISILEVFLKLGLVYLLMVLPFDKLVVYGILTFLVQILIRSVYNYYCKKTFRETSESMKYDKVIFFDVLKFASWTFTGQLAYIGYTQGINILMNMFFGPIVNAARGVAVQVQTAAGILVKNFQVAIRPQIIKSWAQNELTNMHQLIVVSTRYSFYLTAILAFPLIWNAEHILILWLTEIPMHTVEFVKIILYSMLADAFCHGMIVSVHATGELKKFQTYESAVLLSVVPIAYCLLKFYSVSAESVMWVYFYIQIIAQLVRMIIVLPQIKMDWKYYIVNVFPRVVVVLLFLFMPILLYNFSYESTFFMTLFILFVSFAYAIAVIFLFGTTREEKTFIISYVKRKICH